jgi:ATP/maltotriose-dependent transcriptional regulator MalT
MVNCLRHPYGNGQAGCGQNLRARARDGSMRWLSLSHVFTDSREGQPSVVVHIFRDITPELAAKRLLGRLAEQLAGYSLLPSSTEGEYEMSPQLTERELQVLTLLVQGEGTSSIARKLTISNTTARNHIQNILGKLGAHTRLEAVACAMRNHLVDPGATPDPDPEGNI